MWSFSYDAWVGCEPNAGLRNVCQFSRFEHIVGVLGFRNDWGRYGSQLSECIWLYNFGLQGHRFVKNCDAVVARFVITDNE